MSLKICSSLNGWRLTRIGSEMSTFGRPMGHKRINGSNVLVFTGSFVLFLWKIHQFGMSWGRQLTTPRYYLQLVKQETHQKSVTPIVNPGKSHQKSVNPIVNPPSWVPFLAFPILDSRASSAEATLCTHSTAGMAIRCRWGLDISGISMGQWDIFNRKWCCSFICWKISFNIV